MQMVAAQSPRMRTGSKRLKVCRSTEKPREIPSANDVATMNLDLQNACHHLQAPPLPNNSSRTRVDSYNIVT